MILKKVNNKGYIWCKSFHLETMCFLKLLDTSNDLVER